MKLTNLLIVCTLAFVSATAFLPQARAEAPKVIPASDASRHVDEAVTVEMAVRSTGNSRKERFVFLNTHENFRSNQNFTLVFTPEAQSAFKKAGIDDIEKHYFKKVIQATGKVRHFKSVTDMQIDGPDQIRVIGEAANKPDEKKEPSATASPEEGVRVSEQPEKSQSQEQSSLSNPYVYGSIAVLGVGLLVVGVGLLVTFRNRKTTPPEAKPVNES